MDKLNRLFIRFWVRKGRLWWSKIYRKLFERKYLRKPLPELTLIDTEPLKPEQVMNRLRWVLSKIEWRQDKWYMLSDAISYPQTVWAKKADDCDGFAILSATLLERARQHIDGLGEVVILTVVGSPIRNSHTITCFNLKGHWYVTDNDRVYMSGLDSIEEIAEFYLRRLFRKYYCWQLIDIDLNELKYVEL